VLRFITTIEKRGFRVFYRLLLLIIAAVMLHSVHVPALAQEDASVTGPRVVAYISSPGRAFVVTDQVIPIMGTVIVDPELVDYWKVEIRGTARNSFLGNDLWDRTLAFDWLTIGDIRTDTVIEGELARLPHWPGISPGSWLVRLVVVGRENTFVVPEIVIPFTVQVPPTDPVFIDVTYPAQGQVLTESNAVQGSILMDQWSTAYRIELLGGQYTTWTPVDSHQSNTASPTRIQNAEIGTLPPLAELAPGQYRLRIVVMGWNGQYRQNPREVSFAVGTDRVTNLASIELTSPRVSGDRITINAGTPLIGTVIVPEGAQYYKVEIKDDIRNAATQQPLFTDWTTLGATHPESVMNGQIEFLAGPPVIAPGTYRLRVVVVGADGSFSGSPYEIGLTVREA
jgi:hypothetical protein